MPREAECCQLLLRAPLALGPGSCPLAWDGGGEPILTQFPFLICSCIRPAALPTTPQMWLSQPFTEGVTGDWQTAPLEPSVPPL